MKSLITVFAVLLTTSLFADDISKLKTRWIELNQPSKNVNDGIAEFWLKKQNPDGSFIGINYKCTEGGLWDCRRHWHALKAMARSFRYGTGKYKSSPEIRRAVIRGIEYWTTNKFRNHNWWYQSIGIPLMSTEVILIMGDNLPKTVIQSFRPILDLSEPGMTGQNRVHLAMILFLKGLIYADAAMIKKGRDISVSEITVTGVNREGLQADFSYHQHYQQMQFGNYGMAFLTSITWWAGILRNTKYELSEEKLNLIIDYFMNGMRWVIYRKLLDFSACGRQIVGDAQKGKFISARKAMLKLMVYSDKNSKLNVIDFFQDNSTLTGNRFFWRSDFIVHRRKSWYCSIKMCSSRVVGSESTNNENMLGRNVASGVALMLQSGKEYLKLMPLWNWRRLPGLTALQDRASLRPPDRVKFHANHSPLVGGVSNGICGSVMMELKTDQLEGRKSYLCFDNYIVAIGTGIKGKSSFPVNTTMDSCWYPGKVVISDRNRKQEITEGCKKIEKVSHISYGGKNLYFIKPTNVSVQIEYRERDWSKIQPSYKGQKVTGRLLTIFTDHGVRPQNASYAYIQSTVKKAGQNFVLLAVDNHMIHAGYDSASGISFAMFYAPGILDIPGVGRLEALQAAAVMTNRHEYWIADPTQSHKTLKFSLNGKKISIDTPQGIYAGNSIHGTWTKKKRSGSRPKEPYINKLL